MKIGSWTTKEDAYLADAVQKQTGGATIDWMQVASLLHCTRTAQQCRERWGELNDDSNVTNAHLPHAKKIRIEPVRHKTAHSTVHTVSPQVCSVCEFKNDNTCSMHWM